MYIVRSVALILTVIGGINWGLVGLFQFDLVRCDIRGRQEPWFADTICSIFS